VDTPSLANRREQTAALAHSGPGVGPLVVLVAVVATPVGLALMLDGTTYDTWGAFVWGPAMVLLSLPLCRWVAGRTREPELAGFFFAAAALKIVVGAGVRYYMVDAVYGAGDAFGYDRAAGELVDPFRRGDFGGLGEITGTRFLEVLNGVVQAIIGKTMVGSFLVFSTFSFVGMCLLYLAFCEGHPTGDRTLYRRLLFLTPTIWFWPSSVGKEAFLMLTIGSLTYGFARVLNGHLSGFVFAGLGLWGSAVVRPHIALMLLVGIVVALPPAPGARQRRLAETSPRGSSVARYALPLLVVIAIPASLSAAETFFKIDGLNLESATEVRDDVVRRTSTGGSEFAPPDTSNPVGMVQAIVTVIARPFPGEGSGFQALAAAEGICLLVIIGVAWWRRRGTVLRGFVHRWPRLSIAYVVAFAWGFSAVSNFGILARQRSLMLPFVFVLAAVVPLPPAATEQRSRWARAEIRPA
jgi:hypothetical protein